MRRMVWPVDDGMVGGRLRTISHEGFVDMSRKGLRLLALR